MLSVGIDYDAVSWKVALWDEEHAADLHTFACAPEMWEFLEEVRRAHPAAPTVLPSGFGVPVTRAGEILDQDILEMTLGGEGGGVDLLGSFLAEARRRIPRAFCIPAVRLLPTLPPHRKRNRFDLGTADVLCIAAWILHSLDRTGHDRASLAFLLVDIGAAGRALLAIRAGRIVDGIGRTTPGLGEPTPNDAQALLAARGFEVRRARVPRPPGPGAEPSANPAAFWEGIAKESHALLAYHGLPEVFITGERCREAREALGTCVPCASFPPPGEGYESALGAAVLAAGLTGGPTAWIVDGLGLREARDRALDWIAP
jgi:predicted butyrate kinase (DUF1464 family)